MTQNVFKVKQYFFSILSGSASYASYMVPLVPRFDKLNEITL